MIGIFGAGGFGREVREYLNHEGRHCKIIFVDNQVSDPIDGTDVLCEQDFFDLRAEKSAIVAIADGVIRKRLFDKINQAQIPFVNMVSVGVNKATNSIVGDGHILCQNSVVSVNTVAGRGFHLNVLSYLAHDCRVGDFVTIGPNVVCAGYVTLEDGVYLGAGSTIRQGTKECPVVIGRNTIVGMGSVVLSSIPPNVIVAGNPAKIIKEIN